MTPRRSSLLPLAPALALAHPPPPSTTLARISKWTSASAGPGARAAKRRGARNGESAYGCPKRSDSRQALVCAATMVASTVVRACSASAVSIAFVPRAASSAARTVGSGRRLNSSARTCGRMVGFGFVSQSRRAGGTGGSGVRWSGWSTVAATQPATKVREVVGKKQGTLAPP
jgi:hypothetical protein